MESKSALKWIIRHTKKHTAAIVTIAVATALNAAIYVCLALITKNIVNAIARYIINLNFNFFSSFCFFVLFFLVVVLFVLFLGA